MEEYSNLNINQKIQIKQYAMRIYGKRYHLSKPNAHNVLNELQINWILSF